MVRPEIGKPIELTYRGMSPSDPLAQAQLGIEIVARELGIEVNIDPKFGPYVSFPTLRDAEAFAELIEGSSFRYEKLFFQRQPSGSVYVLAA